jgi:DNA-binding MarR family transcriptional regulator
LSAQQDSWGFLVADVARLLRRAFERQMTDSPISLAEARALYYVSRHEGVRQIDLADMLEIQPIRLTHHIDTLEKLGLVERRPDPNDRRAYHIFPRPKAKTVLATFEGTARTIRAAATKGLSAAQVEALHEALDTIRGNLHGI